MSSGSPLLACCNLASGVLRDIRQLDPAKPGSTHGQINLLLANVRDALVRTSKHVGYDIPSVRDATARFIEGLDRDSDPRGIAQGLASSARGTPAGHLAGEVLGLLDAVDTVVQGSPRLLEEQAGERLGLAWGWLWEEATTKNRGLLYGPVARLREQYCGGRVPQKKPQKKPRKVEAAEVMEFQAAVDYCIWDRFLRWEPHTAKLSTFVRRSHPVTDIRKYLGLRPPSADEPQVLATGEDLAGRFARDLEDADEEVARARAAALRVIEDWTRDLVEADRSAILRFLGFAMPPEAQPRTPEALDWVRTLGSLNRMPVLSDEEQVALRLCLST